MQVRESAGGERPQMVQRGGSMEVGFQHAARIGPAASLFRFQTIDQIPPVAGQLAAADFFHGTTSGFGELAGDASHAHHGFAAPVSERHGHLEQYPQLAFDGFRCAVLELFGAIPTLEQEPAPGGRLCEETPETDHLLGHHQGWHAAETGEDALEFRRVVVDRLLLGREALPAVGVPGRHAPFWTGSIGEGHSIPRVNRHQPNASIRSSGFRAWTLRPSSMRISGLRSRRQR